MRKIERKTLRWLNRAFYLGFGVAVWLGGETAGHALVFVFAMWGWGEVRYQDKTILTQRRALRKISDLGFQSAKFSTSEQLVEFSDDLTHIAREALKETNGFKRPALPDSS